MGVIIQREKKSTEGTRGTNKISRFTDILERWVLNNPFWPLGKKGYCPIFSQENKKAWQISCFFDKEVGHM